MIGDLSRADLIERRQILLFTPDVIDSAISGGISDALGGTLSSTAADAASTVGTGVDTAGTLIGDAGAAGGALSGGIDPRATHSFAELHGWPSGQTSVLP